jgi:hypothetical protein
MYYFKTFSCGLLTPQTYFLLFLEADSSQSVWSKIWFIDRANPKLGLITITLTTLHMIYDRGNKVNSQCQSIIFFEKELKWWKEEKNDFQSIDKKKKIIHGKEMLTLQKSRHDLQFAGFDAIP